MLRKYGLLAALLPALAGCGDTTGPEDAGRVAVRFQAATSANSAAAQGQGFSASVSTPSRPAESITIAGGGHTLTLEDIRLIVAEIELERAGGECRDDDGDDCEEFEGGPFLVNLLDGSADEVVTALIPPGTYSEFEFEVEDLEADEEDDSAERRVIQDLLTEVRRTYPRFPSDASMVVKGTFNGKPFTVYFDAEIEVEKEFATPFRVPEDGAILVNLDPSSWFMVGGRPLDLSAFDGQTLEFEMDFENGIEIEVDD